jgi:hypothetical protein
MSSTRWSLTFLAANIGAWLLMVVVLVLVPDTLARWTSIEFARVVGWAIASGLWIVAVGASWQQRVKPLTRFAVQLVLWVSAALVAIWISEQANPLP